MVLLQDRASGSWHRPLLPCATSVRHPDLLGKYGLLLGRLLSAPPPVTGSARSTPVQSHAGVEMRAEAVDDVLFGFVHPPRYRSKGWYAYVTRDIERPNVATQLAVVAMSPGMYGSSSVFEVNGRPSQTVVPP